MKPRFLVAAVCIATSAAFAQDLTWADLARRPEIWPAQCTVKRAMKFAQETVSVGQKVEVLAVRDNQIELATAKGLAFAAKPEDTDALALSAAIWKKLTPKQRELTFATLLQRQDLWPYRVKLTQEADLGNMRVPRGESVILHSVEGSQLLVVYEKGNTLFDTAPRDTDLIIHAWKAIENPADAPSRYAEELNGKLVSATTGSSAKLDAANLPRYYAFYRGASWCGPCRQFSPSLVKFYNRIKPDHPEFEMILISDDKNPADMYSYAKEEGFAWPAVPASQYPNLKIINPLFSNSIPQLVVADSSGKVLIDSARVGREPALKQLEALLINSVSAAQKL
ncbi:MAG TPA: thioredoxin-like domain-containing protein [Opitutus sp.]|nr:thioredoxin-like domain-containing protein [Opitutus sp.]